MKSIKVNKDDLLTTLKANKDQHVKEYKEALRGYRVRAAVALSEELKNIEEGREFNTYFSLNKPVSYEKEYATVIGMLEMDLFSEVELDMTEFVKYVNDDWSWKSSFSSSNSGYSGYSGVSGYSGYSGFSGIKFSKEEQ
jgi:hypothetical protein